MDNTQGLSEAMHRAAAEDRAKSQEQRIQTLESQVQYLMTRIDKLSASMVAQHNFAVNHGYGVR